MANNAVGEQITVEQLIEKRKVMTISKEMVMNIGITSVDILGTGVPRLACLRPTTWLHQRPGTARLRQQRLKTLARGQASRGGRHQDLPGGGPARLAPEGLRVLCKVYLTRLS